MKDVIVSTKDEITSRKSISIDYFNSPARWAVESAECLRPESCRRRRRNPTAAGSRRPRQCPVGPKVEVGIRSGEDLTLSPICRRTGRELDILPGGFHAVGISRTRRTCSDRNLTGTSSGFSTPDLPLGAVAQNGLQARGAGGAGPVGRGKGNSVQ